MTSSRTAPDGGDRLAKVIARAGLCSRRDAEAWIVAGRVSVNGKVVKTPAFNVTERDKIAVDGAPLVARQGTRLWLYHKPEGLVVTEKDPEGRPSVFDELEAKGLPRVLSVGRLDINTEGLLLLTNDGGLKRVLELPATGWLRRYRVRAHGSVTQDKLDALAQGITVDGISYGPIDASLERELGANVWLSIGLREGKNREVKNVLGALGLEVNRLIRVSYGPFQLGELPVGGVEVVRARVLRDQLGKKLAEEAGVDFDSDLPAAAPALRASVGRPTARPGSRPMRPDRPGQRRQPERDVPTPRMRKVHFDDGETRLIEDRSPRPRRDSREEVAGRPVPPARERSERDERPRRGLRPDRTDRSAHPGRPDRPDRPERSDRADRSSARGKAFSASPDRSSRPPRTRPSGDPGAATAPKALAGARPARKGGRTDGPRSDRAERGSRDERAPREHRPRREDGASDRPVRREGADRAGRPGKDNPTDRRPPKSSGARQFGSQDPSAMPRPRPPGGKPGRPPARGKPGGPPRPGRVQPTGPGSGRPSRSGGAPRPGGPRKPRGGGQG